MVVRMNVIRRFMILLHFAELFACPAHLRTRLSTPARRRNTTSRGCGQPRPASRGQLSKQPMERTQAKNGTFRLLRALDVPYQLLVPIHPPFGGREFPELPRQLAHSASDSRTIASDFMSTPLPLIYCFKRGSSQPQHCQSSPS